MKAVVAYIRTSTADKGQNPDRQRGIMQDWAKREGVRIIDYYVDDGTSALKTNPFERPVFNAAVEAAKDMDAVAVLVESVDRFTRQGPRHYGWADVELEQQHNLRVWSADVDLETQQKFGGEILAYVKAAMANEWVRRHSAAVASGLKRAKEDGFPNGRPGRKRKQFTEEEHLLIENLRNEGYGWSRVAQRVNEERGVHRLADLKAQRRRRVAERTCQRAHERWKARQNQDSAKIGSDQKPQADRQKEVEKTGGSE